MGLRSLVNHLLPGTIIFLILGVAVAAAMLFGRESLRRGGRLLLVLLAVFYIVVSTKVGADLLLAPLYRHDAFVREASGAHGATAVVLLGGGGSTVRARGHDATRMDQAMVLRLLEAVRVYRLLGSPFIIVAGGFPELNDRPALAAILAKTLRELGIPPDRIVLEPDSRSTRQHVENLQPYLDKHQIKRFVLVTSPEHMWRSAAAFRAGGYDFVTSAAAVDSELPDSVTSPFAPDDENLARVVSGWHEYVGLVYYWWKGWL